ncbi:MAG: succinate dehydrogenase assembly factor 4 [Pseudomonadota bacterium]
MKDETKQAEENSGEIAADIHTSEDTAVVKDTDERPREIGGRKGPDPTRYGDWEKNGRCIDF